MRQPGTAAAAQAPTLRLLLNVVNFSPFRSATNSMTPTTVLSAPNDGFPPKIGIGGHLAMPPLSHHRAGAVVSARCESRSASASCCSTWFRPPSISRTRFAADNHRRQKLSPLIDRINDRYGRCAIGFGLFPPDVRAFKRHAAFHRVPERWEF